MTGLSRADDDSASTTDMRLLQIERLVHLGAHESLGLSGAEYAAGISEIPEELRPHNPAFPYLVLADPRLTVTSACNLMRVVPESDTLVRRFVNRWEESVPSHPYWMRVHFGPPRRTYFARLCIPATRMRLTEPGVYDIAQLTLLEGLSMYAQYPNELRRLCEGDQFQAIELYGSVYGHEAVPRSSEIRPFLCPSSDRTGIGWYADD